MSAKILNSPSISSKITGNEMSDNFKSRTSGPRMNRGTTLVLHYLRNNKGLHTAKEIWDMLRRDQHTQGLTTIYRALDTLQQMELVQEIAAGKTEKSFEFVEPGKHHHHLICVACNDSVHLDQCFVDDMRVRIESRHNFTIRAHVLEILGLCEVCRKL